MSDHVPSSFFLPSGADNPLLEPERQILASVSEADVAALRRLSSESLTKERHQILGVRSEDLLYFIQCVQKGYIPVAIHELRGKSGSSHIYLSANPDSTFLHQQDPKMFNPGASFQKMVKTNLRTYAETAQLQTIYRNVIEKIPDRASFQRAIREYVYEYYAGGYYDSVEEFSIEMAGEQFYQDLLAVLKASTLHPNQSHIYETRDILLQAMPELETSLKAPFAALLESLPKRSGICLAFSDDLARAYAEDRDAEDADDLVYHIPNGKLPLDFVLGFEPLGEYKDELLAGLGV